MKKIKGFTLIELLVVIGVIGILAAGLLAAIDPMEQLKKGRDTRKRSTSVEFVNAVTRYYAVQGTMPWTGNLSGAVLTNLTDVITKLITQGELKPEFASGATAAGGDKIYITGQDAPVATVYACFDPESKAISRDPTTIYNQTGVSGCDPLTTTTCYWCAK
jgi:prepilin-type N-terminal cleavage/methylation domain-containing protein